jgi:hypothetical protein
MDIRTGFETRSAAPRLFVLLHNGMMSMMMRQVNKPLEKVELGAIVPGVDTERPGTCSA